LCRLEIQRGLVVARRVPPLAIGPGFGSRNTRYGQAKLPYGEQKAEVEEKHVQRLGEIPDLKPGASGAMTLNLRAGSYLLICNQPGHYAAGMATTLVVTK